MRTRFTYNERCFVARCAPVCKVAVAYRAKYNKALCSRRGFPAKSASVVVVVVVPVRLIPAHSAATAAASVRPHASGDRPKLSGSQFISGICLPPRRSPSGPYLPTYIRVAIENCRSTETGYTRHARETDRCWLIKVLLLLSSTSFRLRRISKCTHALLSW